MKKFLSILLAVMLLLSVSSVAMADTTPGTTPPAASATQTFNFRKV